MHRGAPSRSRPGEEEFETHRGSKDYDRGGHRYMRGPYGQMERANPEPLFGVARVVEENPHRTRNAPKKAAPAGSIVQGVERIGAGSEGFVTMMTKAGPVPLPKNPFESYIQGYFYGLEEGYEACPLSNANWLQKQFTMLPWLRADVQELQRKKDKLVDDREREVRRSRQVLRTLGVERFGIEEGEDEPPKRRKRRRRK